MTDGSPRHAATLVLVRDGERGIEVLMLRRRTDAVFAGGAHVFPGGALDGDDRSDDVVGWCEGRSDAEASALLGLERGGLAFWVAAVRECFEEAGLLLARHAGGPHVSFAEPAVAARFSRHRAAVHAGERSLVDVCREEGLRLALGRVHVLSHWVTPRGMPRRYDTRFFVAAAPPGQVAAHDERETVGSMWAPPAEVLARHAAGELDLVLPTVENLAVVARFASTDALLSAAAAAEVVPPALPGVPRERHGVRIRLPGDPGYRLAANRPC